MEGFDQCLSVFIFGSVLTSDIWTLDIISGFALTKVHVCSIICSILEHSFGGKEGYAFRSCEEAFSRLSKLQNGIGDR